MFDLLAMLSINQFVVTGTFAICRRSRDESLLQFAQIWARELSANSLAVLNALSTVQLSTSMSNPSAGTCCCCSRSRSYPNQQTSVLFAAKKACVHFLQTPFLSLHTTKKRHAAPCASVVRSFGGVMRAHEHSAVDRNAADSATLRMQWS